MTRSIESLLEEPLTSKEVIIDGTIYDSRKDQYALAEAWIDSPVIMGLDENGSLTNLQSYRKERLKKWNEEWKEIQTRSHKHATGGIVNGQPKGDL